MKVVCDACQAKYQIPDERVAGRKLKIRCRKCGAAIIVHGERSAATCRSRQPASRLPRTARRCDQRAGEVEWHVSIDGEQHGPYPTADGRHAARQPARLGRLRLARELRDWKAASDSDTLVRAVVAAAEDEPTAAVAAPVESAAASPFADENDPTRMAQSPTPRRCMPVARTSFAARAASRSQPPENSLPRAPSQPPMTSSYVPRAASQPPTSSAAYSQPPTSSAAYARSPSYAPSEPVYGAYEAAPSYSGYASPRASAHELTGERHEDSVLFAAQNLSLSAAAAPAPAPSSRSAGYAAAEGSGLIDIRALAALARTNQAAHAPTNGNGASHTNGSTNGNGYGANTNGNGRSSDLLVLANQTGAFSHLDSLAPIDRASRTPSKAVPAAILAGSMMVAAALLVGILLTRSAPQQPVAAASTVAAPVAIPTTPEPAAAPSAAPVAAPAAQEPAAAAAPEPAQAEPVVAAREPAERPSASSGRRSSSKAGRPQKALRAGGQGAGGQGGGGQRQGRLQEGQGAVDRRSGRGGEESRAAGQGRIREVD